MNREFAEYIEQLIAKCGYTRKQILQRASLEESYGYKILNGRRRTGQRDYIIAISLAMHLSITETEKLLTLNGMKPFIEKGRDGCLIQAIKARMSLEEADELLEGSGYPALITARNSAFLK